MMYDIAAFEPLSFCIELDQMGSIEEHQAKLREKLPNRRQAIFDVLLKDFLKRGGARILEIGVFQASNIKYAMQHYPNISEYSGIDDYGNSGSSPYVSENSYWSDMEAANKQYEISKQIYDGLGQNLYRETATEFVKGIPKDKKWDIIFVDGNHKYKYALEDMKNYYPHVESGGLMLVDDYANSDTPEVTRAVMHFVENYKDEIERISGVRICFVNSRKIVPTSLIVLGIHKR